MALRPRLTLLRRWPVPLETLFAAWTDLDRLSCWWAGRGGRLIAASADARPGGRFWFATIRADGSSIEEFGVYRDVLPNDALRIDWESAQPEVTSLIVQLLDQGDHTELTLIHRGFADTDVRDRQQARWLAMLDALGDHLTGAADRG